MQLTKSNPQTCHFEPLESIAVTTSDARAARIIVADADGHVYVDQPIKPGKPVRFRVRGTVGGHTLCLSDRAGNPIDRQTVRMVARTQISCDTGPYARLFERIQQLIIGERETKQWIINGKPVFMLFWWSRDHVYTLKAAKYWIEDVRSCLDYWLESQTDSGMFWDTINENKEAPAPSWLGEALGEGWFKYDEGMKYIIRRVPVLADTEYVFTEGVWYAWKASGDDAWMARQLPRLEKALTYMTTDPLRWSKKFGLVRRSFTPDEWDFANSHYCAGDHRCIHPDDPTFLFHGNNSGLYSMYWRMAEMYEHLGNLERAKQLRTEGQALRQRANDKLFFGNIYGHMIPEMLDEEKVYALVGDERKRMSLSTGYTINRGLPTHAMAVKILKEYQRRGRHNKKKSFAEWWTMDPMYTPEQWPLQNAGGGCAEGEYMNGGICAVIAGEIAKAAFDHGMESYGVDILRRVWDLMQRDGNNLHQIYKRLPEKHSLPPTRFQHVDLRSVVNRGLAHHAPATVEAWLNEGDNDLRNLPVGKRRFGAIEFDVIDPRKNAGRAVLRINASDNSAPARVTIPVNNLKGQSIYFMHALAGSAGRDAVEGIYDIHYGDGTTHRVYIRNGKEIGLWWGIHDKMVDGATTRRAWWGANGVWKNVGLFMFGCRNPYPDKAIAAIEVQSVSTARGGKGIMLASISLSDQPVQFEVDIRSGGLPDCWAQAAVYYAIGEGLAGIEDQGPAFSRVKVSPRWASADAERAQATLHYPASDGYCAYDYHLDSKSRRIQLDLTGSFQKADVHCLLPAGKAKKVLLEGKSIPFKTTRVEKSNYADFTLTGVPAGAVVIEY